MEAGLLFHDLVIPDWCQEWIEMAVEILGSHSQVPVEQEEELLLHEVNLSDGESEVWEASD